MPNPHPPRRVAGPRSLPPRTVLRNPRTGLYQRKYRDPVDGRDRSFYGTLEQVRAFNPALAPRKVDRRLTLADYLELWLAGMERRANTIEYHRGNVERYIVPTFGTRIRLVDLGPELIRAGYARIRENGGKRGPLSPRTVASIHATLRRALAQAVADDRIERNPAIGILPNATTGAGARARRVGSEIVIPTDAELRTVAAALEGDPLYALFMTASLAGLRQSEELALRWSDIADAGKVGGVIRVDRTLVRDTERFDDPKTERSRRAVPFDAFLGGILRAHQRDQRLEYMRADRTWSAAELVFSDAGAPLRGTSVSNRYADRLARLGIRHRWHDLRHAYATRLLSRGVSIEIVSKRMGHADVSITSRTYSHVRAEPGDETAAIAAAAFKP